jgi:hypothetical protein
VDAAYFDNRLSPAALTALEVLNGASADAQALADRTFRLMRVARFDAVDLSVHTAQLLGTVPRSVPSASATTLSGCRVLGVDPSFDHYLV